MPSMGIQSSKMLHDNKKTIYYDNALLKVYDIPFFIFKVIIQSLSRERSGFLPSYISDTRNLGSSIYIPYFLQ